MLPILLLTINLAIVSNAQLYFPDENGGFAQYSPISPQAASPPIPKNLTALRGTAEYETYVDQIVSSGLIKLTLAIDKVLKTQSDVGNIIYAPVSIGGALALVLLGSNGKTFQEIKALMGLAAGMEIESKSHILHEQFGRMIRTLQTTSGFDFTHQVRFASAIFIQENYPIRPLYKEAALALYESEILNVNFKSNPLEAQKTINDWVSQRTNAKIINLIPEPPSVSTKVILASAMYFKALWEYPFFDGSTRRRPFYTNGRKSPTNVQVEMMSNGGDFPYFKDTKLNVEILGFPYKGNQTTMYVIKPFDSNAAKLKDFESSLIELELTRLIESVKPTPAVVLFPKMKIESTIDLKSALELLGAKSLFNPNEANLALLSPGEGMNLNLANFPTKSAAVDSSAIIFNRMGAPMNCSDIFNANSTLDKCEEIVNGTRQQRVLYKKIGNKVARRITRQVNNGVQAAQSLSQIRKFLNDQGADYQNPGLYADRVIHKVYMDITETGTEAAAATSVSLTRDGSRVTFRVDVPFLFFIRHESTRTILFWGSITTPTPYFQV